MIRKTGKMRGCSLVVLLAMVISMATITPCEAASTTDVKVFITEGTLGHALNRSMLVGETRSGWGIELNKGRTVKKATWSSSDSSILTVTGSKTGATVTTHKEGTAKILLTVVTNEDETVQHDCIVSSITSLKEEEQAKGYAKSAATLYRGASTESEVRNTAPAKQEMTVIALCGEYFRVKLPASYDFGDELNQDTAYVQKQLVEIPMSSMTINDVDKEIVLTIGEKKSLSVTTKPTIATKKEIEWSSSNSDVVSVNTKGEITANRKGTAQIKVKEIYSGLEKSVTVTVKAKMIARATKAKQYIILQANNDMQANYLQWDKPKETAYFKLFIGTKKDKRSKVKYASKKVGKKSYTHKKLKKGKTYYYYVKAYTNTGKCIATSNKVSLKATAPNISVEAIDYKQMKIIWKEETDNHTKGISGYRIYRSNKKNGKYKCVKRIDSKKTKSWINKGLTYKKTYYYKVCAFKKKGKKRINGAMSAVKSAKLYSATEAQKKNWECFLKNASAWQGVKMQWGNISDTQSTQIMRDYTIFNGDETVCPYVKYHLTPTDLYIHLYIEFCTYTNSTTKGVVQDKQFTNQGKAQGGTYCQEIRNGINYAYSVNVKGNENDFGNGVQFNTKMIIHEKGKESYNKNQSFLQIGVGGVCDCPKPCSCEYWFHTSTLNEFFHFRKDANMVMYLPTNEQLVSTREGNYEEELLGYRATAAHELGHALGLNDAYSGQNGVSRLYKNHETCVITYEEGKWMNIMAGSRRSITMTSNDIEMLLIAYGKVVKNKDGNESCFQSYRDYIENGIKYIVSDGIKIRRDE